MLINWFFSSRHQAKVSPLAGTGQPATKHRTAPFRAPLSQPQQQSNGKLTDFLRNNLHIFRPKICSLENIPYLCSRNSKTSRCHSSVGRAKDWKSLCPRFDSWWHHEESQQKDENLWISTNSEVFFLFQLCKTCRFRNFNRAKFVAFFWATEKSHDLICKAQIFTYLHSVRFIKH